MSGSVVLQTELAGALPLIARGKVRDLYDVDDKILLFVATDRISAYDVILKNGIPNKGALLTQLTAHWFSVLSKQIPSLKTHLITLDLPKHLPASVLPQLQGRSMQVRKLKIFPIEAIVRGYVTGSAWKEYQAKGTIHGVQVPARLKESQKLPGGALYTPSTKAEAGQNDENIHPDKAAEIVGEPYAKRIEDLAIQLYMVASTYAEARGIILADTKFEFGLDEDADEVVLVDEVLTPDSSRFWSKASYAVGRAQDSFDKQYLRDWLVREGLKGKEDTFMSQEVVEKTAQKYQEAFEILVGKKWAKP